MVHPIVDAAAAVHPHVVRPNIPSNWFVWFVLFIWLNQTGRTCATRASHRTPSPRRSVSGANAASSNGCVRFAE